ncbi:FG-nucleoporin nsp1 [Coemansia asiatica]|uniref:FG-nucleoporin nsp1 n=1 Tax=Coemansia asiatica TaxID=1052880 RepID=A0A9W7XLJ5_9FUNG|nr:FG-nucleoporin nsp1 [Coemansia asiatica]
MFGGGNGSTGQSGGGFSFGGATGGGSVFGSGSGSASNDKPKTEFPSFSGFGNSASTAPGGASIFGAANTAAGSDAVKPATPSFGFGTPSSNPSTSGGLFGAASSASSGTAAATAASKADGAKPTFSFGSNAAGPSGSLFGNAASSGSSTSLFGATKPPTTTAATTTGPSTGGFKLSTAPASSGASADDKKTDKTETKPATAASTSGAAAVPAKIENSTDLANAALRGKTLEEIAQMWTSELAAQTRAFHTQANTVSYWDRALVQQGKRITELYEATMAVEAEQAALDQSLEHMEGQQNALQNLLDTYEGHVQDIVSKTKTRPPAGSRGVAMTADEERDHVYSSAERLNTQLDELTRRLTALVEDVNGISSANTGEGEGRRGNADPFAQIVQILNAHLSSLEWINSQTAQLQDRVKSAQRVYQDVSSAQSSLSGAYGSANEPSSSSFSNNNRSNNNNIINSSANAFSRHSEPAPVMPGGFSNDPAPPVFSSFGMPASATAPKQQGFSFFGFGKSNPSSSRRGF